MNALPLFPALLFVTGQATEPWGVPDLGQQDKAEHCAAGFVIGAAASALTKSVSPHSTWLTRTLIGAASAAVVGAAKEVVDHQRPRSDTCDPKDALATAAGGAVGALTISLCWRF